MSEKSGGPPPPSPPPPGGPETGATPPSQDDPLRGSRTSGVWIATAGIGILLVLLVIFIVQNTQQVDIRYLRWEGRLPLGAALLIAAAAGILITTAAGGLRIIQLRRRVKRETRKVKKADKAERKRAEKAKADQEKAQQEKAQQTKAGDKGSAR